MTDLSTGALQRQVNGRLNGRISEFHLAAEAQGLVLRGKTRSYHVKQIAQHLVMEATRTPILANDIEVICASGGRDSSEGRHPMYPDVDLCKEYP